MDKCNHCGREMTSSESPQLVEGKAYCPACALAIRSESHLGKITSALNGMRISLVVIAVLLFVIASAIASQHR
jgi:hypothetical protein